MPDRTTKVTLTADTAGYVAGMDKAASATKKMTDGATSKLAQHSQALQTVGVGALALGAAAAAGVALAVSKFAEFDKAMSNVQAATHESSSNMGLLREAAIKAGADTVFSATEAANAIEELSKAGLSTSEVLGGALTGSLSLASAGELGVAEAAGIMSTALTQFHQPGSAASHVADLLAAGAGKAMGSVEDLSGALNQGGLVASQAGMSIEETTGTLAAFAAAGLLGSDAGTSLKTMLLALEKPSKAAQDAMETYKISVYDSTGNMFSMSEMAGQLQDKLGVLSAAERNTALATIFGTDAVRSASVLYDQGAGGIQDWIDKTNDAGYAAETARLKLDNLSGDVEQLGGSIDTALIKTGSGANDVLRGLTQATTGLVNGIGGLPAPVLAAGLALGGVVAVTGLLGGGFLTLVPKIVATKAAMTELNLTGKSLAIGFAKGGLVMAALTAVTVGLTGVGTEAELTAKQLSDLMAGVKAGGLKDLDKMFTGSGYKTGAEGIKGMKEALDGLTSSDFWKNRNANKNVGAFFDSITGDVFHLSDDLKRFEAQFKQMGSTLSDTAKTDLPAAADQFNDYVKALGGGKEVAEQLLEAMEPYQVALQDLATANGVTLTKTELLNLAQGKGKLATELAKSATEDNSGALKAMSGSADDAEGAIGGLSDTINNFGKAQLDVNSAQRAFQAAIDDLSKSVHDNGTTLDITTEKGRNNQSALDDIAKSSLGAASAILAQTGSQEDATKAVADGRAELIRALAQFGITGRAAEDYADKLGLVPSQITTAAYLNTDPATRELDAWLKANSSHRVNIATSFSGGQVIGKANGGILPGAPSRTDNMFIHAASGEFLTRAQQAAIPENRRALEYMNAGGVIPGYATGGMVGFQPAPVYTPAPPRQYMPGPGAGSAVSVSLDGARIVMEIGGEEIAGVIRGQAAGVLHSSVNRAYAGSFGGKPS